MLPAAVILSSEQASPKKAFKSEKCNTSLQLKSENSKACKFYEIVNQAQEEEGKQAASEKKKQAFVSTI